MNENLKGDTAKVSARRRLVRGVFSAPAALTLYSGSVAAASVSCVANQLTNAITQPPTTPDVTLVRVPLYILANGQNSATFVRQADIDSLTPPGGSYLPTAGQAQCVGTTGNSINIPGQTGNVTYVFGNTYINPTQGGGDLPVQTSQYVAVRVSSTGKIEGVLVPNLTVAGQNTALHASCWTSFGGAAPFN